MTGTLILDAEGLSKLVRRTPELTEWLAAAEAENIRAVASSVTLAEARAPVTVLTSDPEDLLTLCDLGIRVIKI